jgi:hypothetical protein
MGSIQAAKAPKYIHSGDMGLQLYIYRDWPRPYNKLIDKISVTTWFTVTIETLINSWFRYNKRHNSDYWPNLLPCWLNGITDRYNKHTKLEMSLQCLGIMKRPGNDEEPVKTLCV